MADYPYKRKELLVYPKLQFTIVGVLLASNLILTLAFFGVSIYVFNTLSEIGSSLPLGFQRDFFEYIEHMRGIRTSVYFSTIFLVVLIGGTISFIISYKIAGPMYRLCKHMEELTNDKNPGELNFRKGDYFPHVRDSFNTFWNKFKK